MRHDFRGAPRRAASPRSRLCRPFGLAAVAGALNQSTTTLNPATARAVERGAAALFLAGFGAGSSACVPGGPLG
jgi:hypothetical protein